MNKTDYPHYQVFFWGISLRLRMNPMIAAYLKRDGTAKLKIRCSGDSFSLTEAEEIAADIERVIEIARRWEAGLETSATIASAYKRVGKDTIQSPIPDAQSVE